MTAVSVTVNGTTREADVASDTPLLWLLRDDFGLTGTKYGCGIAHCGACTVHLDGQPVRACTTSVADADGRRVDTVEGLANGEELHPLQAAWIAENVPQCGFCQSGQLMSAADLLARNPEPTDADIDAALASNLCRCGTYQRIRRAVHRAARDMREQG